LYSGGALAHIGNNRGVIHLLVSRTETGVKNTYNTADSAISYVTLAEPVFEEIDIAGLTARSGTYLYQSISAGISHLLNFKFLSDESSLELRRIF
jgi:hypothetical protein